MRKISLLAILSVLVLLRSVCFGELPKNIILFIGDGMGFEQVKAAGMFANGTPGTLCFESFPHKGEVTTYSANSSVTDSAASGTAIATGHKVNNGVISLQTPGDGSELETMLEYFKAGGKMVGLVTTTYVSHATPAAFGAHEPSRNNYSAIAADLLNRSKPEVLFGGAKYITPASASAAGYSVITTRSELLALNPNAVTMINGQFGSDYMPYEYDGTFGALPHLSDMTDKAIDILATDTDGFFLMVEGGRIDHAGHNSNLARNIYETIEFADSVQKALDWAQGRDDTLIIVTADHETGGLVVSDYPQGSGAGDLPPAGWTGAGGHTGVNVPVYAMGPNAEQVTPIMNNTDYLELVTTIVPVWPDFVKDGKIDIQDAALLARNWQRNDCNSVNDWCEKTDLDRLFSVDLNDLNIFAGHWLEGISIDVRVTGSENDAEENIATGSIGLTSTDLELITDGSTAQYVGMRFTNIHIPPGSAVSNAYIQFTVDETANLNPCSLTIYAQDSDDSAAFSSNAYDISLRPLTTASVSWFPGDWTVVGQAELPQRTPDISSLIQEVIDRPGFEEGNSIVIIITGTGRRTAESYNGDSARAPLLHISL